MAGTLLIDEHNSEAVDNDLGDKFICHCGMMSFFGGVLLSLTNLLNAFQEMKKG